MSTGNRPNPTRSVPVDGAASASTAEDAQPFLAGLFGRGLLYVAVTALPLVTATVVSPVLAHLLGPVQFGLLASALAVYQVLMAVAIFGIDQSLILVRAESGEDRSARVLITVGTALAAALMVLVAVTVPLWSPALGFGSSYSLAVAVVCWTAPSVLLQLGLALLLAQDRFRRYALVSVLLTVGSQLLGLVFVLVAERTSALYAWGGIAGRLLAVAACLPLVRPLWYRRGDWPVIRGAFVLGLPIMLGSLSMFVLNSADRLVIQSMLGPFEAGRYQIAYTIGFEAITVFAFTGEAWAARFAGVRDDAQRWRLLGHARNHLYELLAPALLAVNLAAPLLLRIFAPESFRPGGLLLVVLLVTLSGVPLIAALGSTRALITQHRTKPIAVATAVAAVVNIGLNVALVPVAGLACAAAATAVSFGVQAVILRMTFRPYRAWPRVPGRIVVLLLCTTAVATVFVFVDQSPKWIAIRLALALLSGVWLIVAYLRRRSAYGAGERRTGRHRVARPGLERSAPSPELPLADSST